MYFICLIYLSDANKNGMYDLANLPSQKHTYRKERLSNLMKEWTIINMQMKLHKESSGLVH